MTRLLLLGGAVAAVFVPLASGTNATFPGKPTGLVYQAKQGATYDLYRATADGKSSRLFVNRPKTDEFNASWAPDGNRLVFQSGPTDGSDFDLWVVSADGKGAHAILTGKTNDRSPQFCGLSRIVFTRQLSPTSSDVYALDFKKLRVKRLTTDPSTDSFPTCNRKGDRIAFIAGREGNPRIYEMSAAGSNQHAIAAAPSLDPDYSPDGKLIAYVAPDADGYLDVFTRDLATGVVVQRSNGKAPYDFRLPKFAPSLAARLTAGLAQEAGDIATTQKHRTTGAETLVRLRPGTAVPTPLGDAASGAGGSGGSWEFAPLAPDCVCKSFKVKLNPAAVFTGLKDKNAMKLRLFLDTTLRCTGGAGQCSAAMYYTAASPGIANAGYSNFYCGSDCGRIAQEQKQIEVAGDERFGYGRRGTGTGGRLTKIDIETECNGKTRTKKFIVFFDAESGKLNYDKSDLNGDGKADGA